MERDFYTRLVYEHKCPDDFGPDRIEVSKTVWDCDAVDVLDMFHTIFIGSGFYEDTFKDVLAKYLLDNGYSVEMDENTSLKSAT